MPLLSHCEGYIEKFVILERNLRQMNSRYDSVFVFMIVLTLYHYTEGKIRSISWTENSHISLNVMRKEAVVVVAINKVMPIGFDKIYNRYSFLENASMSLEVEPQLPIVDSSVFNVEVSLIFSENGFESKDHAIGVEF